MRFPRLKTLGARLLLLIVALATAGVVAELVFLTWYMRTELTAQASSQLSAIGSYVGRSIDRDVIARREMLDTLASRLADGPGTPVAAPDGLLETNGLFRTGVELVDRTGKRLFALPATLAPEGDGTISRAFLERALADGFAVGRPVKGPQSGVAQIAMAVPVRWPSGAGVAVLVGITPLRCSNFLGALYDTHLGQSGGFVLVSPRDGLVLGASDDEIALTPVPPEGRHHQHDLAMRGIYGVGIGRRITGVEEVAATVPIPSAGWFVAARIPTAELFAPVVRLRRDILALGGIAAIVLAGGGFVLLQRVLRPLRRSAALADRMAREEIPFAPLPTERDDEVGQLTFAFNRLLATLLDSREAFKRQALCDGLTGLANRAAFDQTFARALSRARRRWHAHGGHGTRMAVLFLDLDNFKTVNDRFGHEAGDAVLKAVAQRLSAVLRQEDVLARVGGDEFAVLLTDLADMQADVARVADHCRAAMAPPVRFHEKDLAVGLSIGRAVFPDDGETTTALLAAADHAMYRNKAGRTAADPTSAHPSVAPEPAGGVG